MSPSSVAGKLELMHLVEQLKIQKRTGWVRQGIQGPESIADHMYRMAILSLLSEEDEELDIGKCVQMAVVHDLAEASVGDITPFDGISRAEKQKMETDAMNKMTHEMLDPSRLASKRIHALYHEYEEGNTREAKFVKDLDRIEMALQASEYEKAQDHKGLQPFFESSIPKIQHPEVQTWAEELMRERQAAHANDPDYKHVSTALAPPPQPASEPKPPTKLLNLPSNSIRVTDPDEEIFLLYTQLSLSRDPDNGAAHGLGFVDSKTGLLQIELEVSRAISIKAKSRTTSSTSARAPDRPKSDRHKPQTETIEAEIYQDLSGLRSRSGDTGSVVWSASIAFAKLLLGQHTSNTTAALFQPEMLKSAKILELGSGTGVLPILLAPLFGKWTATDIEQCLPLIQKNIKKNAVRVGSTDVDIQELDWTWSELQLQRSFMAEEGGYDLLLAVDCLYNEAMVTPFVKTINSLETKAVMVVSELRTSEVQRLFLETWLASDNWEVWRICQQQSEENPGTTEGPLLGSKHVVWVGWRADNSKKA